MRVVALEEFLLERLVDPLDHGALIYSPDENLLVNPRRGVAYEVRDGIAVLLPDEARTLGAEELARYEGDSSLRRTGPPARA